MEKSICPICMGELKVIGSRKRKMIDTGGETVRLVVRRLRCMNENCRRIHHELPDVVVPYKMHTAATFEKIIGNDFQDTPAEESTIARIRKWFIDRADALVGGLLSIYTAHFQSSGIGPSDLPGSILGRIHFFVEKSSGWLKRLVRILVNNNRWVHTRLAYVSGKILHRIMS